MLPTIAWQGEDIVMVDQRKLPADEIYVTCKSVNDVAKAIKNMVIRGAPAIGVCAAMGLALGASRSKATGTKQFTTEFQKNCELLAATRPTAVNLFWAIERMKRAFAEGALAGESVDQLKARLRTEADRIHDEDIASCRAIGAHGAALVPAEARILTHCNAGALATAGYGTALGVIRGAVEAGRKVRVLADETRPFLQGARLTAWELMKDGIDTTVITDNMAGRDHARPATSTSWWSAPIASPPTATPPTRSAPTPSRCSPRSTASRSTSPRRGRRSTCRRRMATRSRSRSAPSREVTHVGSNQLAPDGAHVRNPSFDVTPAKYITAIITEKGHLSRSVRRILEIGNRRLIRNPKSEIRNADPRD